MALANMTTWSNLLMQKKNITERFKREFITINHQQMALHSLKVDIMDESGAQPLNSVSFKIKENMNCRIILCWEHIAIIGLPNCKCILMHTK